MKKSKIHTIDTSVDGIRITYTKKHRNIGLVLTRYFVSIMIFAVFFGISRLDFGIGKNITEVVRTAIVFDFGKTENRDYGHIPALKENTDSDTNENKD